MSATAVVAAPVVVDVALLESAAAQTSEHLHDTLVQDLLATRFLADLVQSRVAKAFAAAGVAVPPDLEGLLTELTGSAATASSRGRAHMNAVKPRALDGRDLPGALALLGEAVTLDGDLLGLPPTTAVVAYRTAQAWLADGSAAVTVTRDGPWVRLDAQPFTPGRGTALWAAAAAALGPQPDPFSISLPASTSALPEEPQ